VVIDTGVNVSALRLVGIILGLLSLAWAIKRLRSRAQRRTDVWLLLLVGSGLTAIGLFPSLVNILSDLFMLTNIRGGRVITLLLFATALLWLLFLHELGRTSTLAARLSEHIRGVVVKEYLQDPSAHPLTGDILVIIPAYNEANNLERVLPKIPLMICGKSVKVLVVDDGSRDETAGVAASLGAGVARHTVNFGGGAALETGYQIARALGPDVLVSLDGDGQHDPGEIETLVAPIVTNQADLVIGSRFLGSADHYSVTRLIGVKIFSGLINRLMGTRITDCASGFRALRPSVLKEVSLRQEQYHTAELIIIAAKHQKRIVEKPIHMAARYSGQSKKGRDFQYGLGFLKAIIRTWLD